MAERIAYLNDEFLPYSECKIHVYDRGFRVGDTVYEAERTFNGEVFRLHDHLKRLYRSLTYVRIDVGLTLGQMQELTLDVLRRNEPIRDPDGEHRVIQFVTRGPAGRVTQKVRPTVGITVEPIDFSVYARFYQTGAHVVFPRTRSYPPQCIDPKVKHYSRMNFNLAELEAADIGPDTYPVLLDLDGNITENIGGNFFVVTDGLLRTPTDRSVLQGISRMTVLELASQLGIPTREEDLQPYDAYTADEVFLATTSYCILPVGRIDNRSIGREVPGPITNALLEAWSDLVGLDIVGQALPYAGAQDSLDP